ncbi:hypothetical protein TcCL_Unassigned00392 [Trypanosoma cruzi]|nr:hypothetical protein TcCL_Unassigned00392 [Trypanosoma cruzi]
MHAHTKATESVILLLSLSSGSGTLLPSTHTHKHAIAQAAVTRSTRHIHRHNHRIRITRYISSTPSSRHAHGQAAEAKERDCQHALQKEHSNPLQCASCGCVFVCLQKHKNKKKTSDQSMWRDAQK